MTADSQRHALVARVRAGWESLGAGPPGPPGPSALGPPSAQDTRPAPRFSARLTAAVSPSSLMCPPGWIGIVTIEGAVLATAPDQDSARAVQDALASVPPTLVTNPAVLRARLPVLELLGPASLAYLEPADFRPVSVAHVVQVRPSDRQLCRFLDDADSGDVAESGLTDITSPAFAVFDPAARDDGTILSVSGYQRWPNGSAHLSVLTAATARGRGFAKAAASAASGHALASALLPQWRARPAASMAVARSLGFTELGAQASLRIAK